MAITAANVKALREKTSAGMMDCKKALQETNGDMDAAVDWLRKKGIAKADKKASRVAAEGLVALATSGNTGALVEVNSETDFVSRNDGFQAAVVEIAQAGLEAGSSDELAAATLSSTGKSVTDSMKDLVGKIGENMNFRRMEKLETADNGVVVGYMHNQVAANDGVSMGKIGVLVGLEGSADKGAMEELAKKIAMHVAATNPLALSTDDLDADVVAKEREMLKAQALEEGKPEAIVDKMVEGRMQKFFKESVLMTQIFVMDGENTIAQVVKNAGDVNLVGFRRMALGEGIEKKEEDFAAEVAKTAAGG